LAAELGRVGIAKGLQRVELQLAVDADGLRAVGGQVAQHALGQVQVFMQQRAGRLAHALGTDGAPGLAQVGNVVGQLFIGRVFGVGAQDEAAGGRAIGHGGEFLQAQAQLLAQLGRADLLRDAEVVVLRQEHQHAPGDADLGGQPRALGADRVLDHLHHQGLALEHLALDRHLHRHVVLGMVATTVQISHMQERGALQPHVDEGTLHAGQNPGHLAQVDVADQAAFQCALDVQVLHRAVLDQGDAGLLRGPVDQDVMHGARVFLWRRGALGLIRLRRATRPPGGGPGTARPWGTEI
jgi:hypothetical protein